MRTSLRSGCVKKMAVFDFVFGGIIMWRFREQKIQTQLTLKEISLRFEKSKQFVVNVEDKKIKMREESFLSNKVCYPIIEGLIDGQDNYTNLIISFKLSKSDKIALHLFLLIVICLSIIMCFLSHDILVLVVVLSWGIIMSIVFLSFYIKNCKRALMKLSCLLDAEVLS